MDNNTTYRFPYARYPAVRLALLFAAGIVLADRTEIGMLPLSVLFGLASGIYLLAEYRLRRQMGTGIHAAALIFYLLSVLLFGILWFRMGEYADRRAVPPLSEIYPWEQVAISGTVYTIKPTSTGKYQLDIAVDSTRLPGDTLQWTRSYNMRVVLDPAEDPFPSKLQIGSEIKAEVTVYPLEGQRNPHDFDYRGYLASRDIFTQAGLETIRKIRVNDSFWSWHTHRRWILARVEQNFDEPTARLAKALLLGYKDELDRSEKLAFSRAGLSHIMAVSGLHVGFILAPFWFLIPWFWTFRYGKPLGLLLLVMLLTAYAGITGFSASVCRASLTAGLITYGKLYHKIRDSLNLTAVAAIILLLINPGALFTPGFQLSFSAVYIILLTVPVIERWLPAWIRFRWYGTPVMVMIISVLVQVGLFPLLTYHFGEFSLVGPLANAVVVPWLGILVPWALVLLLVPGLHTGTTAGFLLNYPTQWFLAHLQDFTMWISDLEGSWIRMHVDSPLIFLLWLSALIVFASVHVPRLRWKMVILFLVFLACNSAGNLISSLSPKTLQVTIYDVGQGDAALVQTPNGRHVLIDTGRWTPDYNSARYVILPHLKAEGIDKLDAVFLSHPHADHIGGIIELLNRVPIDRIYHSGYPYDSDLYERYQSLAREKGVPVKALGAGDRIEMDPAILLLVYGPAAGTYGSDPNEHSLVLELVYGQTELLFMGDAGKEQEQRLLTAYDQMLDTDFLKVGHHGSKTSSSHAFMATSTPQVAVVSLGNSNRFGHPHPEAVQRIKSYSERLYFTSLQKALVFTTNGTKIWRTEW